MTASGGVAAHGVAPQQGQNTDQQTREPTDIDREHAFDEDTDLRIPDLQDFFTALSYKMFLCCASCSELTLSASAKWMPSEWPAFSQLEAKDGERCMSFRCMDDARTHNGQEELPLCGTCYTALRSGRVPRRSTRNGLWLGDMESVPPVFSELNMLEQNMIALAVPFMTVKRLPHGGQMSTIGHTITFPNEISSVVRRLPRPLERASIVWVRTNGRGTGVLEPVRPNMIREALLWLREHNPLYAHIIIDEEVLAQLENPQSLQNARRQATVDMYDDEAEAKDHDDRGATVANVAGNVGDNVAGSVGEEGEDGSGAARDVDVDVDGDRVPTPCEHTFVLDMDSGRHRDGRTEVEAAREFVASVLGEAAAADGSDEKKIENSSSSVQDEKHGDGDGDGGRDRGDGEQHQHREQQQEQPVEFNPRRGSPMREYEDPHLLHKAFPCLFPYGKGGLLETNAANGTAFNNASAAAAAATADQSFPPRVHAVSVSDTLHHWVAHKDRRHVRDFRFLFFALNMLQRRRVAGVIVTMSRLGLLDDDDDDDDDDDATGPATSGARARDNNNNNNNNNSTEQRRAETGAQTSSVQHPRRRPHPRPRLQLTHNYDLIQHRELLRLTGTWSSALRGSQSYWYQWRQQILATVESIRPPNIYFTVSAADTL